MTVNQKQRSYKIESRADADQVRNGFPAVVYVHSMQLVLAIGGFKTDSVSIHSLEQNNWRPMHRRLKQSRNRLSGCVMGNFVYIVCGIANGLAVNSLERAHVDSLGET